MRFGNRGEEGDWRGGGTLPPALSCSSYHSMLRDLGRKADSSAEAYSAFLLFSCFCLTDKRWANLERLLSDLGKGRGKALMSLQHPGARGPPDAGGCEGHRGALGGPAAPGRGSTSLGKASQSQQKLQEHGLLLLLAARGRQSIGRGKRSGEDGQAAASPSPATRAHSPGGLWHHPCWLHSPCRAPWHGQGEEKNSPPPPPPLQQGEDIGTSPTAARHRRPPRAIRASASAPRSPDRLQPYKIPLKTP